MEKLTDTWHRIGCQLCWLTGMVGMMIVGFSIGMIRTSSEIGIKTPVVAHLLIVVLLVVSYMLPAWAGMVLEDKGLWP
jgi:hypothetical protein